MAPTWWRRLVAGRAHTTGYPTSANRASSFHLRWGGLPPAAELVAAAVNVEVVESPTVDELYFWALQVSFAGAGTGGHAGAHLGLQWHPAHPGATAVNWGGYAGGGELEGTDSPLPSATGNPNTRDFAWSPGRPYRLMVAPGERPGWWRGTVDATPVRELPGGGHRLTDLMVWSEVFARCEDPPVVVRWSAFEAVDASGRRHRPDRVTVSYQSGADGGCDNTDVVADGDGVLAVTNRVRTVAPGTVLALGGQRVTSG